MTDSRSNVVRLPEPSAEPKPVMAPAYLRERGFSTAREVLPAGARVSCARPIWVFYGDALKKHFLQPKRSAR